MINIKFEPDKDGWPISRAQAYYTQQIAFQLEKIGRSLEEINNREHWRNKRLDEEIFERQSSQLALSLISHREQIKAIFSDYTITLSDFTKELQKMRHIMEWCYRGRVIREGIRKTDYLELEKSGNGYRVRILLEVSQ